MTRGSTDHKPDGLDGVLSGEEGGDKTMAIAVVGMSCRLPGGATDPERLWQMCAEQRDVWQPIPKDRLNTAAFYHPDPGRNGTSNVRGGHFLNEDLALFDAASFNLTTAEARAMDPQQRLLLELSYEALENAGVTLSNIARSDTAVFMGSSCRDYADMLQRDPEKTELFQSTGLGQTMLANRISYFYNLTGPSVTVDTACSSSLVALHLACNAIRLGEAKMAISGGCNLILNHEPMLALSMLRFLSPDGRCYTYDERANGFGRGEGAACIILKPLKEALNNNDTIRGVIRHSGTNQDGRTLGITLPSGDAQLELMKRTYEQAGLDPADTSYVEAHGTGTATGDPIEASALSRIFNRGRPLDQPLTVGSLKSNIGHLEGGSGIASVVKAVLMLEKNLILPNLDFQKPNPRIPMQEWRIDVPTFVRSWPSEIVHRASVNNFGFGGSNAHVIIDDANGYLTSRGLARLEKRAETQLQRAQPLANGNSVNFEDGVGRVFVLSSFNEISGERQAKALARYLNERQGGRANQLLNDLAYTLCERRSTLPYRAAFFASSPSQLASTLNDTKIRFQKLADVKSLAFVFTGQGAQWYGMGRELIDRYPVFHQSLKSAEEHLRVNGAPWSLFDELHKSAETSLVNKAYLSQPLTTAIQIALVDLLESWSIRPTRVAGHSSGEIAAAYCAGALTQKSALAVSYYRGLAVQDLQRVKDGAMLAVGLSELEVMSLVEALTSGRASVACVNSPSSTTVSGDKSAILELQSILQERKVFTRRLAVDIAYHSHHMEVVADKYLSALENTSFKNGNAIQFYSSVSGQKARTSDLDSRYWVSNMVNQVRFSDAMTSLLLDTDAKTKRRLGAASVDIIVEIGPHSALQGPIRQILQEHPGLSGCRAQYKATLTRNINAIDTCHALVCQLFLNGYSVNLSAVNDHTSSEHKKVLIDLPPNIWRHSSSYWAESSDSREHSLRQHSRSDVLGVKVRNSNSLEPRWRNVVRPSEIPWLNDHVVQSNIVYPAAGFLAMAVEAEYRHTAARDISIKGYSLREVTISHALIIPSSDCNIETMLSLRPFSDSVRATSEVWDEFSISSSIDGASWIENCRGLISIQKCDLAANIPGGSKTKEESAEFSQMVIDFETECIADVDTAEVYSCLDQLGLSFRPLFTNMKEARVSADKCVAKVAIPNTSAIMPATFEYPFIVHPATLDSCIHAVFPIGLRHKELDQGTPLPTFIQELYLSQNIDSTPDHIITVYAESNSIAASSATMTSFGQATNSLTAFDCKDASLSPAIVVKGLILTPLTRGTRNDMDNERRLYYQTAWEPDPTLLSTTQIVDLGRPFCLPLPEDNLMVYSSQVAFYYAERALSSISIEDVSQMCSHHVKLYHLMQHFCKKIYERESRMAPALGWLALDSEKRTMLCDRVGQTSYGELLCGIGEGLPQILRKEVDPLSLMVKDDRLERHYRDNPNFRQLYQQAANYIGLIGNQNPNLRILEIGGGTGSATYPILEALGGDEDSTPNFSSYDFTDISPAFFGKAADKLQHWQDLVSYKKLDIENDPSQQGFVLGSYDLILAANVLHATASIKTTLEHVRSLLKPGGTLILIEITVSILPAHLIFGTLPGWWVGADDDRQEGPILTEKMWDDILRVTGFSGADAILWDVPDITSHHSCMISSTLTKENRKRLGPVTVISNDEGPDTCLNQLVSTLALADVEHNSTKLSKCNPEDQICVVLSDCTRCALRNPSLEDYEAIKRIFLNSAGVLWVTRGALIESSEPDCNLGTGFARTIRAEKGDTMIITLDLDAQNPLSNGDAAKTIFSVLMRSLGAEYIQPTDIESEYAERNGTIMIPRLIVDKDLTSFMNKHIGPPTTEFQPLYQDGRSFRGEIETPGLLDSIRFVENTTALGTLPDDHVEIEVKAAGINFRDVMTALGQIASYPLGCECSGVVSAVGPLVREFKPGNHVIANVEGGSFCTTIRAPAGSVESVPQEIPFEVAATLPIAYFTAYWAVFKVAHLRKNDTVLIHTASGGLGQALINLCQLVGAEIFATVGTIEKRRLLLDLYNIPEDHIFSSRDGSFAKGVMKATKGKGIDVIMNSLSGEALRLTWNCIAPFGRFVELGKRDFTINSRLEMRNFEKNVSFTGLDVPLDSGDGEKRRIWNELMELYLSGSVKAPHPITTFGFSDMENALRIMQSGKHMGKLVLIPRADEVVKVFHPNGSQGLLKHDASYLLVGGLGGLGRSIASWMLQNGARNFIMLSPSGLTKAKSREAVSMLQDRGARVAVFKCDIANISDLDTALEESSKGMPPIRGMIHTAMVFKADLVTNLSLEDYNDIMRLKVDGIWHLHDRLSKTDLDFFTMLSSIAGLSGNPSQAPYNAASTFQDAFADYRNRQGLPAVALDLGRVVDIGIVADNSIARRGARDIWSQDISGEELLAIIKFGITAPLRRDCPGSSVYGLKPWAPEADPVFLTPMFSRFRRAAMGRSHERGRAQGTVRLREILQHTNSLRDAAQKICDGIAVKAASLLILSLEDIDPSRSLSSHGMDSLVAVEMRNWLVREVEVTIPILELLAETSLSQLSKKIAKTSKLVNLSLLEDGEN